MKPWLAPSHGGPFCLLVASAVVLLGLQLEAAAEVHDVNSQRPATMAPSEVRARGAYPARLRPRPVRLLAPIIPRKDYFQTSTGMAMRGMTLGPIEGELQKRRGYGSAHFAETLSQLEREGVNWISLTTFAKVWNLESEGLTLEFEQPREFVRQALRRAVSMAHERGIRVLLVPHLWVESGGWRAELDPGDDQAWQEWTKNYGAYLRDSARLAEETQIDLLAIGVELRSWVTTPRAASMLPLIAEVREIYKGPLTYAANWDDANDTVIWGALDAIGINGFYPLHWENDASEEQLVAGGKRVAQKLINLSERFERPVLFTEFGYTNRSNPAIEPWLWPEALEGVEVDEEAQAQAYAALLSQLAEVPFFSGYFVWRMYADIADMSQEAAWGFSPWGRPAFDILREAYSTEQAGDWPRIRGHTKP